MCKRDLFPQGEIARAVDTAVAVAVAGMAPAQLVELEAAVMPILGAVAEVAALPPVELLAANAPIDVAAEAPDLPQVEVLAPVEPIDMRPKVMLP